MICKVRGLSAKVDRWTREIKDIFLSGRKLSVVDVQDLLETGERLKVKSNELRTLKEKFDSAQDWLNKVIEYTNGECVGDVKAINQLIHEHESLLVELPEEVEELRQAVVGYCLCRRPYEGFMIGCDCCEVSFYKVLIREENEQCTFPDQFSCF
jgi:hypothetical protein